MFLFFGLTPIIIYKTLKHSELGMEADMCLTPIIIYKTLKQNLCHIMTEASLTPIIIYKTLKPQIVLAEFCNYDYTYFIIRHLSLSTI